MPGIVLKARDIYASIDNVHARYSKKEAFQRFGIYLLNTYFFKQSSGILAVFFSASFNKKKHFLDFFPADYDQYRWLYDIPRFNSH